MQIIYVGIKGMVDFFIKCWVKELFFKYGCMVNVVLFGLIQIEGFLVVGEEVMKILQFMIDVIFVGKRMGKLEEIVFVVVFFCEEWVSWVNGVYLFVNGGFYIDQYFEKIY